MMNTASSWQQLRVLVAVAGLIAVAGSCASGGDAPLDSATCETPVGEGAVQRLVDDAEPGDLIVLPPGVYHESVTVTTPDITIEGADRSSVIFDGCGRLPHGLLVMADRVVVQNLTVHDYLVNGVFFNGASSADDTEPLVGFGMHGITAYDNGLYGLYAFQAHNGVISDSYASGHGDSGIYVGQCDPCSVLVTEVVAEHNAVGYEGVNASRVYVVDSDFSYNRIGITPNSQNVERYAPQRGAFIAGNTVRENNSVLAPEQASGGYGMGIVLGGGHSNTAIANVVTGNQNVGIAVTSIDAFVPKDSVVRRNTVTGNGVDLAYWTSEVPTPINNNVFSLNAFGSSSPENIEAMAGDTVDAPPLVFAPGPAAAGRHDPTGLSFSNSTSSDRFDIVWDGPYPSVSDY